MTRFITANGSSLWAAVEPDTRCNAPKIERRRFNAYMAPFKSEEAAIEALVGAGGKLDAVVPPPKPWRLK